LLLNFFSGLAPQPVFMASRRSAAKNLKGLMNVWNAIASYRRKEIGGVASLPGNPLPHFCFPHLPSYPT